MKVRIGDTVYSSEEDLIVIELNDKDKELIGLMSKDNHIMLYCPDHLNITTNELNRHIEESKLLFKEIGN